MTGTRVKDALRPFGVTARRILRRELRLSDIGYARAISYSQFGEDLWLARRFEDQATGFYVDVGAYDPFNASNTLLLYRRAAAPLSAARHQPRRRDLRY
jgi:hypothetical protein